MRTTLTILAVAVALTGGGSVFAAQTKTAAVPAAKAAVHTMSGTLMKFETTTNMLTLSTAKGEERFVMGSGATFHEGQKVIVASDLQGLAGHRAEVRYTESGGMKTAEVVTVSAAPPAKGTKVAPTSGTAKPKSEPGTGEKK